MKHQTWYNYMQVVLYTGRLFFFIFADIYDVILYIKIS